MGLTDDPNDPRLGRGVGGEGMNEAYLVLSEEERKKGWVRPLRRAYTHVGPPGPHFPLRDLTKEEQERYAGEGYIKYEEYPPTENGPLGSFWSQERLDKAAAGGCGASTKMALELCETYAKNPRFYGATYCVGCRTHLPLNEFTWDEDGEVVGS